MLWRKTLGRFSASVSFFALLRIVVASPFVSLLFCSSYPCLIPCFFSAPACSITFLAYLRMQRCMTIAAKQNKIVGVVVFPFQILMMYMSSRNYDSCRLCVIRRDFADFPFADLANSFISFPNHASQHIPPRYGQPVYLSTFMLPFSRLFI